MNYLDYRKKLGLSFFDEEKTKMFLGKAYNTFVEEEILDCYIDEATYINFCYLTGIKREIKVGLGDFSLIARLLREHTEELNDFIFYFSVFINSIAENQSAYYTKDGWIKCFLRWANESGLEFDFIQDKDGYFIFPKGAKELDDALVSQPLSWLEAYPIAREAWIKALHDYSNLNDDNASQVADNFRKALETFFQLFFESKKTLENLVSDYGVYLKKRNVPAEISNNFSSILDAYTKYINNYAKHHDKANRNAIEYMMYQTGNIIRLLITLKQGELQTA